VTPRTILCYGDSITWGYVPCSGERYPRHVRWPGRLAVRLGGNFEVIEEGLPGRYTVWDEPFRPGRNGAELLEPILESHAPVDLLILMLGSNDILHFPDHTAYDAARGIEVLVKQALASECGPSSGPPGILVVSPPLIGRLSDELRVICHGNEAQLRDFARYYREVCERLGAGFFDAARVCEPGSDGVHPDERGHATLATALGDELDLLFATGGTGIRRSSG